MEVKDFYYDLPEELIAQTPLENRTDSRLLVLDKESGNVEHRHFTNIVDYLKAGDCLVLNDTKVIPARLLGVKCGSNAPMEFVLLKRVSLPEFSDGVYWEVLLRPGRRGKVGARMEFGGGMLLAEIVSIVEGGNRIVKFTCDGVFEEVLDKIGIMPLPPYIKEKLDDPDRYQTVYSRERGSAAAPTAGLHFTRELLAQIEAMGVRVVYVTLHVGLGTFRPVKETRVEEHFMHKEYYEITQAACDTINETRLRGGKIIAVGTTSCRVLESAADSDGVIRPKSGETGIFIYPGYNFKIIDSLITNFHLPESTLLMLVSALAGRENILNAYSRAIEERYRFFSFGDACLIL